MIHGNGTIRIGDNVTIISDPNVNPVAGGIRIHLRSEGRGLQIGNHVGISHFSVTAFSSITIEDNVLIGSNCMIADTDFHSLEYECRRQEPDTNTRIKPIVIHEGAFIGARSIILKGVEIGRHFVGAGSGVTKNIPDGEIWAGSPAVFIRKV